MQNCAATPPGGDGDGGASYRRKDKSLSVLTDNFLSYCASLPDGIVSLEAAATHLSALRV